MIDKKASFFEKHEYLTAFLFSFITALFLIIPFVIFDGGIFTYYADFNSQQLPFNMMANEAVKAGNIGWNWFTDLGSNFVGSYSFYLLGSPFFWLSVLAPSNLIPFIMGPILSLKLGLMGLGAYVYLKLYVKQNAAFCGSILYAFCGFSIYSLPYNHFHEAMIVFPFLLFALEMRMRSNLQVWFAVFVCLSALVNYYFFIGQAIFLVLYWIVNILSKSWELSARNVVGTIIEAVLGTLAAAVLLLPSFFAIIQNNRLSETLSGLDTLVYSTPQLFADILHSFFFPPDLVGKASFIPEIENIWSAPTAWIPLFGPICVIGYLKKNKFSTWISRLIFVLAVIAFVPILNSVFSLFNSHYYSRWYYMFTLILILATMVQLEETEEENYSWKWPVAITIVVDMLFVFVISLWPNHNPAAELPLGLEGNPITFFAAVGFALLSLAVCVKLILERKTQKQSFYRWVSVFSIVLILSFGWYTIKTGREIEKTKLPVSNLIKTADVKEKLDNLSNGNFYRICSGEDNPNMGIIAGIPNITCFHSIVPGAIMDFYNSIGIDRHMISLVDISHLGVLSLTSTEWIVVDKSDPSPSANDGFVKCSETSYYDIYHNTNCVKMGFSYDYYISQRQYEALDDYQRERVLLHAILIPNENVDDVKHCLEPYDSSRISYDYSDFVADCLARNKTAVDDFEITKNGFSASSHSGSRQVVFFSVPYEQGWSAKVNGKQANIIKSNVGFMSIITEPGDNQIEFVYKTPGLRAGFIISIVASFLLAIWCFVERRLYKVKK